MKSFKLDRLIKQVSETEEEEILCSECLDHVDEYVEAQLAGARIGPKLAAVKQHLGQCRVCREEYEMLRDLVREQGPAGAASAVDSAKPH